MAIPGFKAFPTGYRLIDGFKLNKLFSGQESHSGLSVTGLTSLAATTITGAFTATGGATSGGAQITTATIVAAAGATQGTATAIPATAAVVIVTVTASTEGVKLPTAATGRAVVVIADTAVGAKVYGGAAGQSIGTATTATTAYSLVKNTTTTFWGTSATKWRIEKGG